VLGALFLRLVIDAVSKLIKAGADVYEGMIVGVVVAMAVTLAQFRQLRETGGEFFPGVRGAMAIPALAIGAGMMAAMAGVNVEFLKGRSIVFGIVVGSIAFVVMALVKLLEVRRGQEPR
jgi:hypothetical protein